MAGQVRHLKVKGGRFYARIAVPKAVQAILGKTELVAPIGGDRRTAMRALPGVVAVLHSRITTAEAKCQPCEIEDLVDWVTLSASMKAHYREELASDDRERPLSRELREFMRLSRSTYADRLRRAAAGELDDDEMEALVGYAADALRRKDKAPAVPRERLLVALAEVQLDALAVMEGRDEGRVRPVQPISPLLTQPEPSNDDTSPVLLKQLFRDYIAARQAVNRHRDGGRGWEALLSNSP